MRTQGPENGKVVPNLMCAVKRGGVGASKCEVMIFPPSGALPHTGPTNREEKKGGDLFLFLFLSVQLSAGFKMSLIDVNFCITLPQFF